MAELDLNALRIRDDSRDERGPGLEDPSRESGAVRCFFRHIKFELLRCINRWPAMVGCVAWLTDRDILRGLAGRAAAVVVQKEDFLRPDSGDQSTAELRRLYGAVRGVARADLGGWVWGMSAASSDPSEDLGVRCVGNHNARRAPAWPRSHHKFVVFGRLRDDVSERWGASRRFVPEAVWTGSFNFTANAGRSLENAVLIEDPVIAGAFLVEFEQVAALSEPLAWETPWVAPEWRIGT